MIINELKLWVQFIITHMPEGSFIGNRLRNIFWKKKLREIGHSFYLGRGAEFFGTEIIDIGNCFVMGRNVIIDANNSCGIYIGNNVGIAIRSYLRAANHTSRSIDIPILKQGHESANIHFNNKIYSIVIDDDVWVGANAIILSGSKIGKGSIISAGAVISSAIPPYSIVVGNPGRVIANREKKLKN